MACQNRMTEVALELIKTNLIVCQNRMTEVANELVSISTFTINDIMLLKPEWVPEEFLIMNPVDVTEVDI